MEKSFEIIQTEFGNFLINEYDLIGNFIKHQKYWEYHLYEFYSQILNKDNYCIDAGANLGFHTIQFGNLSKKVYAFEPQSLIFNQLCANILFNGLDEKIIPFKQALGEKEDRQQFWNIEHEDWVGNGIHNWGGRGIIQDNYGGDRAISNEYREYDMVDVITLDSLNIPQCDLIKMDIQGYEYYALLGAKKLLYEFKPVILLENPSHTEECDVKSKQFLLDMGYELYRYCGASNKEDCILIHPESEKYNDALLAINRIKDKYNILQEEK
jgi:FkbM family methyltransferase